METWSKPIKERERASASQLKSGLNQNLTVSNRVALQISNTFNIKNKLLTLLCPVQGCWRTLNLHSPSLKVKPTKPSADASITLDP